MSDNIVAKKPSDQVDNASSPSVAIIAGAIIGAICFVFLLTALAIWFALHRRRNNNNNNGFVQPNNIINDPIASSNLPQPIASDLAPEAVELDERMTSYRSVVSSVASPRGNNSQYGAAHFCSAASSSSVTIASSPRGSGNNVRYGALKMQPGGDVYTTLPQRETAYESGNINI
jgi:hypothetical protein